MKTETEGKTDPDKRDGVLTLEFMPGRRKYGISWVGYLILIP